MNIKILEKDDWHGMKIGQRLYPYNSLMMIERVPGGWVYGNEHGVCFIPYYADIEINGEIPMPKQKMRLQNQSR